METRTSEADARGHFRIHSDLQAQIAVRGTGKEVVGQAVIAGAAQLNRKDSVFGGNCYG